MDWFYVKPIDTRKSVCISALTDEQLRECGAYDQFGGIGYFLYERLIVNGDEEIQVLAHIESEEAAQRLATILQATVH